MKPFINDNLAETYSQCNSLLQHVDVPRDILTMDMMTSRRRLHRAVKCGPTIRNPGCTSF
jgi:hypothetical protein